MSFSLWGSLLILLLVAGLSVEIALGWRKIAQLKDMPLPPQGEGATPRVSLIVSALNEAATIEPALRSLLSIDYPDLEIIVVNDRSTDATPDIIEKIATQAPALRVLHLDALPPGWLGKNHALHRGAKLATGEYLLFTDADAVFDPSAITRAVAYCEKHRIDHLTLFFDIVARTQLLRLLVLSFSAGFMARFKPWKVGTSLRHFVGVGGFNLVRTPAYAAIGGHAAMPLAVLDDMTLGRRMKESGHRQQALFGTGMVTIEWYRNASDMVRGLEKNIFAGFDYQLRQLLAVSVLVLATRVWPWVGLLMTNGMTWWLNTATVCAGLLLYLDLLNARGWSYRCLVFAPVVPLVELWIWWRGCLLTLGRGGIEWRGTRYPLDQLKHAHVAGEKKRGPT